MGIWSFFLADIQDNLDLSDSELGTAVLFVYLGMVIISPVTAYLLARLGSQWSMFIGAIFFGVTLSFIPLANSLGLLIFTMLVYGSFMGIMDISMNSGAILTEIVEGKPLMGSFHGSYSVAAAISSVVGGALSSAHYGIVPVYVTCSIISVVLTVIFHANIYNFKQEELITEFKNRLSVDETQDQYSPLLAGVNDPAYLRISEPLLSEEGTLPEESNYGSIDDVERPDGGAVSARTRLIAFYSMVGFLAAFGESSIVTWSIVYFDREMDASSVLKSLGFTCFMVSMALGRFSCDFLRNKFGRRWMVRVAGVLAIGGLSLVAMSPDLPSSIFFGCLGFSITGMGLSTLIPTMFSSAGHIPGGAHAGTSIAIVSMFTNCGAIVSSPLVGYLSDGLGSMRQAFFCDAVLLGLICLLSWGIPEESSVFKRNSSSLNKTE